jgi:enoyl-CoA hydratase/carnithine racemase
MDYQEIQMDIDQDGIMTLTLHRPDAMNAFTATMMHELIDALDRADADDAVKAVIFTGHGDRAYCAGADLSAGDKTFDYDNRPDRAAADSPVSESGEINWSHPKVRDGGGLLTLRIYECVKPVIGAINGAAVGIGATMLLPMDMRIASDKARFGFVFARRGIVPEACSSWFLPRIVGISQALEWCYSGRIFNAEEAATARLVNAVVPHDQLLDHAKQLAKTLVAESAPVSIAMTRQMMWRMLGADHPMEAHKIDSKAIFARGRQADAKEGVVSFLEKRAANFPNQPSSDMPAFYPWWNKRDYS